MRVQERTALGKRERVCSPGSCGLTPRLGQLKITPATCHQAREKAKTGQLSGGGPVEGLRLRTPVTTISSL